MNVELPDAPAIAAGLTADEARLRVAFSLYREGRLSTPQCAELAGLSRRAFMDELARHRVEAPYALADLEADATTLKELDRPVIVVGDAFVFIALQRIDALPLLPRLFGEVHVPDAVWREVFTPPPPIAALETPLRVVRHQTTPAVPIHRQLSTLNPGEAEAIQLAQALRADLLLFDEAAGRRIAVSLGLKVTGVVGVLIEARRRGEITQLRSHLEKLRAAGFWLADTLLETALRLAGENSTRAGP